MERASRFIVITALLGLSYCAVATLLAAPQGSQGSPPPVAKDNAETSARGQRPPADSADNYKQLVAQGRHAFEQGDYRLAESLARKAMLRKRPGPLERLFAKDSPQKLLKDVARARARQRANAKRAETLQEQVEADGESSEAGTPADDRQMEIAKQMLSQARELLAQGRTSEAARLARTAKGLPVRYAEDDDTPDRVLADVAAQSRRDTLGVPPLTNPLDSEQAVLPQHQPHENQDQPQDNEVELASPGWRSPAQAAETAVEESAGTGSELTDSQVQIADPREVQITEPRDQSADPVEPIADPVEPIADPIDAQQTAAEEFSSAPVDIAPRRLQQPRNTVGDQLLREARRRLAIGRPSEARSLAHQAHGGGVSFSSDGDSPEAILADVDRFETILREDKPGAQGQQLMRRKHDWLLELARRLKNQGDFDQAANIAYQASKFNLPPQGPRSVTANEMLAQIERERQQHLSHQGAALSTIEQTTHEEPAETGAAEHIASHPQGGSAPAEPAPATSEAQQHYAAGVEAMRKGDRDEAIDHFLKALSGADQLDPRTKQQAQDHLAGLYSKAHRGGSPVRQAGHQEPIGEVQRGEQLKISQLSSAVSLALTEASKLQADDPDKALETLQEVKTQLAASGINHPVLLGYQRRVNDRIQQIEAYKKQNAPRLELRERNRATEEQLRREKETVIAIDNKLAEMVDQFNQYIDERRFAEAKLVAENAYAIAPDRPVTQTMLERANIQLNMDIAKDQQRRSENAFVRALLDAEESKIPNVSDGKEMRFPKTWEDLQNRRKASQDRYSTRTAAEQRIEEALRTSISVTYEGTPLVTVLEELAKQAGINLVIDEAALADEGINSNTPVKIRVDDIQLKSVLKIILGDVNLIYVIRDEVLKITNEARGRGELIPVVYPVGDLVLPIPNFVPGGSSLGAVFSQAMMGANSPLGQSPLAVATPVGAQSKDVPEIAQNVLAQLNGGGAASANGLTQAMGGANHGTFGPMSDVLRGGGAANADFDSLIDLIETTIEPESWDSVGGPGSMEPFPLNLSLIISQTEDVHDQIASLLEQLRRLLDLELAVEVRFVTLTDNFFERIGIDFDFDIDDDQDKPFQVFGRPDPAFTPNFVDPTTFDPAADNPGRDLQDRDNINGAAVGQAAPGVFSVDLDIPFRQNSFNIGVPTFGGFTPDAGAQFGFALLSDIEAFFFINAAQADRRTNIVQAPKVVMFNGQFGSVIDFTTRPFLVAVVPLIGAGSVGFTPIIQSFPTGSFTFVQGIISADRRYVRLTVLPFFFQLGEVFTFTTNLGAVGGGGGLLGGGGAAATVPVTLQLPAFALTLVTTTVNVPDGGTVLLGGVKRVNEGRTEAGVPVLNKLPYVNRLFKNVGTGRETQSLMLMVTPRIIIGEEEEELLGVSI